MSERYRIKCSKDGQERIYTCAEMAGNCVGVTAATVRRHLLKGTLVNGWELQKLPWRLTPEEQKQAHKQRYAHPKGNRTSNPYEQKVEPMIQGLTVIRAGDEVGNFLAEVQKRDLERRGGEHAPPWVRNGAYKAWSEKAKEKSQVWISNGGMTTCH